MDELIANKMLHNPDNGKDTIVLQAPAGSFATIKDADQLQLVIERGSSALEGARVDPVAPEVMISRASVYASTKLIKGSKVYHKKRKMEGTVREIGTDGRIRLKFANGEKHWVNASNLVRIDD